MPRRKLIQVAIAIALACAACVFLSLYHRDTSWFLGVTTPARAATHLPSAPVVESATQKDVATSSKLATSAVPTARDNSTKEEAPASLPVKRDLHQVRRFGFTLRHSRFYQSVGPVKVKLLRTNLRHSNADLSVIVGGHRTNRKAVSLDEPLSLASSRGNSRSIALVLDGVSKDEVTGTVIESATGRR